MSAVGRVIVGVSGSPASIAALRIGADHARRDDVPLVAVHAWLPPGGDLAERRWPSPELRPLWKRAALELLDGAIESAWAGLPGDVRLEHVITRGQPEHVLTDIARPGDLLVIGAGRRGRVSRLLHGRVARSCLARARCRVLSVPPPAPAGGQRGRAAAWFLRHRVLTAQEVLRDLEKLGPVGG